MLKIGDKVRYACDNGYDLTKGKVYEIIGVSDACYRVIDDVGDGNSCFFHRWEELTIDDELAELRAFKAAALVRFPALAEPESDDEAAERFAELSYVEGPHETFLIAFAWARANPR